MKIFVDDLRLVPEVYDKAFTSGEDFIQWLSENPNTEVELLSLDHDLGQDVMDGYTLTRELVSLENNIKNVQFHTDNIIGLKNMYYYLTNAKKHGMLPNMENIYGHKVECIDGKESIVPYKIF